LKNFEKSYLAFISKSVFWGAWLPILRSMREKQTNLRNIFPQNNLLFILKNFHLSILLKLCIPSFFFSILHAILLSRI
jgi:hypothetical protein